MYGSLCLDFGPHTVRVFPEVEHTDSRGNIIKGPATDPIVVTGCLMMPLASTRGAFAAIQVLDGQRVDAAWRMMARQAPLGWWSAVEWQDKRLIMLGGPLVHTMSDGTTHVSATLLEER